MPAMNPQTTQGINKHLRRYGDDWEDWQVTYGNLSLPCRTQNDARLLARELVKKGPRVKYARKRLTPAPD